MVKMRLYVATIFLFLTFFTLHKISPVHGITKNYGISKLKSADKNLKNHNNKIAKKTITITAGKNEPIKIKTNAQKVLQAIKEAGIVIKKSDRITPSPETSLSDGMNIEIIFIDQKVFTEKSAVNYKTIVKKDKTMPAGSKIIIQPGKDGIVENKIRIYYKNGEETKKGILSRKVIVKTINEVVIVGTKKGMDSKLLASRGFSKVSNKFTIVDVIKMKASAYEPGPISCGPNATGYTCTGIKAGYGVAAVDPSYIPFGTPMYIDGYGYAIAADRGSAIQGNRIDLCFDSYKAAINFGRKEVKVYILKKHK